MSDVSSVSSSYYSTFESTYGTTAAEAAQEAGLFDSEDVTWSELETWADEQGYEQVEIESPGKYDVSGAFNITALLAEFGELAHEINIEMRTADRESSIGLREDMVDMYMAAADKKIEAADKLGEAATLGLVLTCVGMPCSASNQNNQLPIVEHPSD